MLAMMDVPMAKRWIERYLRNMLALSREALQRVVDEPFEKWGTRWAYNSEDGTRCLVGVVADSYGFANSNFRGAWRRGTVEAAYIAWDWLAERDLPAAVTWVKTLAQALLSESA